MKSEDGNAIITILGTLGEPEKPVFAKIDGLVRVLGFARTHDDAAKLARDNKLRFTHTSHLIHAATLQTFFLVES